ncbi:MAG: hypothetical protein K0R27_1817 [Xanthobacteraceae bacterium]|jgi:hypothetical protein|nr:hypothetical protein [Xanthobacteraceae bacterium]
MRKFAIVVLVLMAVAVGGYLGAGAYAQHEAERHVATLFQDIEASGLKARHAKVEFDLFSRTLTVSDIALDYEDGVSTATIGRITAIDVGQLGMDRVKANRVEIAEFAYDGPIMAGAGIDGSYKIPVLVVEQFEGPTRIATTEGGPGRMARAFILGASAKRITMPSLATTYTVGSGEGAIKTEYSYGATVMEELAAGKVARATSEPSKYSTSGPNTRTGGGTIGKVTGESLDFAASMGVFNLGTERAETFQHLFGKLTVDGMTESYSDGSGGRLGTISASNFAVRPSTLRIEEFLSAAKGFGEPQTDGHKPDRKAMAESAGLLADIIDSYQVGSVEFSDADIIAKDGIQLRLKYFSMSAFNDGRIGEFSFDGLTLTTPNGKLNKVDRFSVHGLKFSRLLRFSAEVASREGEPRATRADRLKVFQFLDKIEIGGLEVARGRSPDDILKVDTLQLSWGDFVGPLPSKMAVTARISSPIEPLADKAPFSLLADGGVERAVISIDGGLNWNEADKTVTATPLLVEIGDAFSASAKVTLTGVDKARFFSPDEGEALKGALASNLGTLEIALADDGIYELKLEQRALDQDVTPEIAQQTMVGIAQTLAQGITSERPDLERPAAAIVDFLSAPKGKLVLKITPKASLPLITVIQAANNDPVSLLDEVNIEATASR